MHKEGIATTEVLHQLWERTRAERTLVEEGEGLNHDWCQREGFWLAGAINFLLMLLAQTNRSFHQQVSGKETALLLLDTIVFPSFMGLREWSRKPAKNLMDGSGFEITEVVQREPLVRILFDPANRRRMSFLNLPDNATCNCLKRKIAAVNLAFGKEYDDLFQSSA
jgi:hypothetical protein